MSSADVTKALESGDDGFKKEVKDESKDAEFKTEVKDESNDVGFSKTLKTKLKKDLIEELKEGLINSQAYLKTKEISLQGGIIQLNIILLQGQSLLLK